MVSRMKYKFSEDLKSIREILGLSQSEFADKIGVEQVTVSRNEVNDLDASANFLEVYMLLRLHKILKLTD